MLCHRRLVSCFLVGVALLSVPLLAFRLAAQAPETGKRVALLVGVNKYDRRGFNDLAFAERDVEELAADLRKAGYEVQLLTGSAAGQKRATLKNIQTAMETVFKGRTKADLVLVALAGHGLQIEVANEQGKLQAESFFCPADAEQGDSKTMLAMGTLFAEIDRRGGGRNLVLVDACREDPTRGRGMDGRTVKTLPEGVAVLFGCAAGQKTYETEKAGGGHGVFFHTVLEGLRGGARKNDAGELTWNSLVDYVSDRVEADVERFIGKTSIPQTPNEVKNLRGRSPVLLTLSASSTTPPPSPKKEKAKTDQFAGAKAGQEWSANGPKTKFCWCPPGKFTMGSPASEADHKPDEDQVSVTLTRGIWLGKHEVTKGEWKAVMHTEPWSGRADVKNEDNCPATHLTWEDATKFCTTLTGQESKAGRLPEGWEYRLPTEAQWEYACRAGKITRYHFGDDAEQLPDYAWFDTNARYRGENFAHAVGQKTANDWGLHDMHGNTWEWCRDWYARKLPGGTDPEVTQPEQDPIDGSRRVLRGGSWYGSTVSCRAALRNKFNPADNAIIDQGLRVAIVTTGN